MTRWFAPLALVLSIVSGPGPSAAQIGRPADPDLASRIERAIEMLATHQDTPGVFGISAAIAVGGRLAWTGGFGHADLQHRVEAGPRMVSRIGSISKPIAAVAALTLVESGTLDLDAPISSYLPRYPKPTADRVTTRQFDEPHGGNPSLRRRGRVPEQHCIRRRDDPSRGVLGPGAAGRAGHGLLVQYGWTVVSAVTEGASARPWVDVLYWPSPTATAR